jgi:hypothetical protein
MVDRLRVTELDFDTIKNNLKAFLKQQNEFTDYDFEGSGLNILLDILAYNTHYNAYYLNMVANEAFLDTALLRDSVVSHAKTLGYTPHSRRSPRAIINFTVQSSSNAETSLTIPKGYSFLSNQIDGKSYKFVTLDENFATKANGNFYFENLEIFEGELLSYRFVQDQLTNPKQIFTLPDENIDTTTITVAVSPSESNTAIITYNRVTDILDVENTSEVFYLQETRGQKYQIYFGNNALGKKIPDGGVVYVSYLSTNASAANKANNFVAALALSDSSFENLTNFVIDPVSAAAGGSERESIDEIKFSSTAQYTTQNRLVTVKDYETFLKRNYPAIDSLSVWGGEDQIPRVFGKIFISIKPKNNYFISELEKKRIIDEIIKPKSIVSITSEIIDPDYLYILVKSTVRYDQRKTLLTSEQLKTALRNSVILYNNTFLNKFNSTFVSSRLQDEIDNTDQSIIGNEVEIKIQKKIEPIFGKNFDYEIDFSTPLKRGSTLDRLISSEFETRDSSGISRTAIIEEVPESFTGISSILIVNSGFGYTEPPIVTIRGDGTGATAKAIIVNGRIESIEIIERGVNYTTASVFIENTETGLGSGAEATAIVNREIGTLRLSYFDEKFERKVINENIGRINYRTGKINLNDLFIDSVATQDELIRFTAKSEISIINSLRNTLIVIDEEDPSAIEIELQRL